MSHSREHNPTMRVLVVEDRRTIVLDRDLPVVHGDRLLT